MRVVDGRVFTHAIKIRAVRADAAHVADAKEQRKSVFYARRVRFRYGGELLLIVAARHGYRLPFAIFHAYADIRYRHTTWCHLRCHASAACRRLRPLATRFADRPVTPRAMPPRVISPRHLIFCLPIRCYAHRC